jgi:tetratricopeptide (TPR) repeat protein
VADLLIGLLSAALVTNPPAAVSNLGTTVVSAHVVNTNDPVETDYRKILEDDDAAEKEVIKWADDAGAFSRAGGGDSGVTLHARIEQRLKGIKAEYENFILLHPDHASARLAYGSFLNDTHDEEGAVAQWDKARQLEPTNPAAWNNLANYYGHRGPVKTAFEYYGKAIELDGRESVYYHNLAVTVYMFRPDACEFYHLTEQQVFDKALELYRKAIELDPDNFVLFSDYAESFYGTNPPRWQDGLAAWTDALKIAHDDVERQGVHIHLARINLKLGHFDAARRSLDAVTNAIYATQKRRISWNLDDAISRSLGEIIIPCNDIKDDTSTLKMTGDLITVSNKDGIETFETNAGPPKTEGMVTIMCGKEKIALSEPSARFGSSTTILTSFKTCQIVQTDGSQALPGDSPNMLLLSSFKRKDVSVCLRQRGANRSYKQFDWIVKPVTNAPAQPAPAK